ncbi:hypothetical protein [Nonomuraea sp. NPDC050691]|uniref:hypothetical protein n=1 Tax=Nonomuraea sp. NPDC050691 TaxID=3155661 RepID=UPI0033C62643
MNTAAKLGSYVLGLAVVFGGALGVGKAVGPVGASPAEEHAAMTTMATPTASVGHGQHATEQVKNDTPGGLQGSGYIVY